MKDEARLIASSVILAECAVGAEQPGHAACARRGRCAGMRSWGRGRESSEFSRGCVEEGGRGPARHAYPSHTFWCHQRGTRTREPL